MRTPLYARVTLYGCLAAVLFLVLTRSTGDVFPDQFAIMLARNSEGFLTLLVLCAWVDYVRQRLCGRVREVPVTVAVGVALLVAGILLRHAPWPSRFVTLNEALLALAVLVPYLQLRRPAPSWAAVVPSLAMIPLFVGRHDPLVVDMAEAFGAMVLVPFVVDVADPGLLAGRLPRRGRNLAAAALLLVTILTIHLVTPKHPTGQLQTLLFDVQRSTEMFVAAAIMLVYFASRERADASVSGSPALTSRSSASC